MADPPDPDIQVGLKAVEAGLLTEAQLADVRRELAKQAKPPSLADALIARGLLTRLQVEGFRSGDLSKRIGKYRLIRELGRGGMGVVYEAEDVELKRKCALKTMIEAEGTDARERAVEEERFVREARLSANLPRHPGIVGVYDAGVVDGRRVIAMELVDGLQFQEWRKKAAFRQQVQALKDVADAVAHAHAHNVVHRDLKPSNILVDAQRAPRVTDFGLAKRSRETTVFSLTATGMIVGTPAYMSPEQAEARDEVGPATDQWALGVMLYEILSGRLPFQGASAVEVLMKTVKEPVVPPTKFLRAKGAVDERLERLCMRALKKDPAERFPSVKAFADGLGGWLKSGTIRRAPKRPAWVPAAAGGGILLAVLLLFLLFRSPGAAAVDVSGLVADGWARIERKQYNEALSAFKRVLAEDPENAAAKAGKREAERLQKASAPESELVVAVRKLIETGDVKAALAKLDAVPEPPREELRKSLHARMDAMFAKLRDQALAAQTKKDTGLVRALALEVEAWKRPDLSAALKAALAAVPAPDPLPKTSSLTKLFDFQHSETGVTTVAISPDGRRALSGCFAHILKVWSLEKGRLEREFRHPTRVITSDFSRDGRWFAVGLGSGDVVVYDAKTLEPRVFKGHTQQTFGAAFSPDSARLFTCSTDTWMRVWTVADGVSRATLGQHGQGAMSLARSSDGRNVAVGAHPGEITIWDTTAGKELARYVPPSGLQISGLAYSPDGARLASGAEDGELLIWDLKNGARRAFARVPAPLHNIAWSPDGRWIAVASRDDALRVLDASSGQVKAAIPGGDGWYSCAFSADSRLLAGGAYNWHLRIYDIAALGR
ncbi:MAG TPA: protein kinase [Planctomycetota bacterium]